MRMSVRFLCPKCGEKCLIDGRKYLVISGAKTWVCAACAAKIAEEKKAKNETV